MTMNRFKRLNPTSKRKTLFRISVCVVLAPFVFSVCYAVLMLIMIAMWKIGELMGDNGKMIPYSCFAFVFLCLWLVWEWRTSRKQYREYLFNQSAQELTDMISAPGGLYRKGELEIAREALQETQNKPLIAA
ncbi:hypothetical protein ACEN2T_17185 [Pseudomonas sp. W22_MBD1_FP4]|uniref:hypothetical protein n=1 Tax=Pseudomonas sp. W22_MBD1_FP4 TaxID=3240272 RepID=UPI003F9C918A